MDAKRQEVLEPDWVGLATWVKQEERPTQWVTALRVAASWETSCGPEMMSEPPHEERTLGFSWAHQAVLSSPYLPPAVQSKDGCWCAYRANIHRNSHVCKETWWYVMYHLNQHNSGSQKRWHYWALSGLARGEQNVSSKRDCRISASTDFRFKTRGASSQNIQVGPLML